MVKRVFFLIFKPTYAHVNHYKDLKKLIFDLYRNNELIGQHVYLFKREGTNLIVENNLDVEIKKFGITLYTYQSKGKEEYIDGKFASFSSKTKQNEKNKFSKIYKKNNNFFIEGSSYKGKAPKEFIIGTWWNHSIIKSKTQISAISGRILEQSVTFLGKENIEINNKKYKALKFNFLSKDNKPIKDKKLNTDIWYDENTLIMLKASYKKKGDWEYRLKSIE